jgi:hypothetical protein
LKKIKSNKNPKTSLVYELLIIGIMIMSIIFVITKF